MMSVLESHGPRFIVGTIHRVNRAGNDRVTSRERNANRYCGWGQARRTVLRHRLGAHVDADARELARSDESAPLLARGRPRRGVRAKPAIMLRGVLANMGETLGTI